MKSLLLDTGFVIALELAGDQHHPIAQRYWKTLKGQPVTLVATSFVVCEVVNYLQNRSTHEKAVRVGEWLMHAPEMRPVYVDGTRFGEGLRSLATRRDKSYSLTGCISFLWMQRLGIEEALTFDRHFAQAGFRMLP